MYGENYITLYFAAISTTLVSKMYCVFCYSIRYQHQSKITFQERLHCMQCLYILQCDVVLGKTTLHFSLLLLSTSHNLFSVYLKGYSLMQILQCIAVLGKTTLRYLQYVGILDLQVCPVEDLKGIHVHRAVALSGFEFSLDTIGYLSKDRFGVAKDTVHYFIVDTLNIHLKTFLGELLTNIHLALFYSYAIHCIFFVLSLLQISLYLVIGHLRSYSPWEAAILTT